MRLIYLFLSVFLFSFQSKSQITITTTVKPIADIVREITGTNVVVNYIIPPNVNFHTYEIKTSDIKKISDSNLFIYIGYGEPNIQSIVKNIPKEKSFKITALKGLTIIKEEHNEIHPALWLDPENSKVIAKFVLDYLLKNDSKNAEYYSRNYDRFIENVNRVLSYGKEKLSNLKNKNFVSYHYEFPYFTNRFGLTYLAEIEMGHGREPTPKHIIEVIDKIKVNNVKSIFTSKQFYNKKVIDLIVSKTGVKVIFLDSQGENPTYIQMIKHNIDKVYEGLSN